MLHAPRPAAAAQPRIAYRQRKRHLADDGAGLAHAGLFDPDGLIGDVAQPLLVQKRKTTRLLTA